MRENAKIVIVGHVDHGKSTLIGRLLLDTNSLPKERIAEIKKISRELGRDTELAYVVDQLKEEREQNITIDTTQIFFGTRRRNYIIIDAPGHVEFIKNMISGASLAEAAILIVGVGEGVMEQTRRHAYIISMLGIENVIVVFNKMDAVNYEEEKFNKIKNEMLTFLESIGITPSFAIPASAKEGENISRRSPRMKWYRGQTLLSALDSLKMKPKEQARKPLRLPVQDTYEIDGEKVIVGKVVAGTLGSGQKVVLFPSFKEATVKVIKAFGRDKKEAYPGENIGLILSGVLDVRRGEVIAAEENAPRPRKCFKGNVFWMSETPLERNKTITLRCATQEIECVAEKIEKRINSSTLEVIEEDAREIKINETGVVIFRADEPVAVENFNFMEELGRFIIEREYNLQGAGIIIEMP